MCQCAFPITRGLWPAYKYISFPCSFWLSTKKNDSNDHLEKTCFHTCYKVCGLRESIKTSLHPFMFTGLRWDFGVISFHLFCSFSATKPWDFQLVLESQFNWNPKLTWRWTQIYQNQSPGEKVIVFFQQMKNHKYIYLHKASQLLW